MLGVSNGSGHHSLLLTMHAAPIVHKLNAMPMQLLGRGNDEYITGLDWGPFSRFEIVLIVNILNFVYHNIDRSQLQGDWNVMSYSTLEAKQDGNYPHPLHKPLSPAPLGSWVCSHFIICSSTCLHSCDRTP